MVVQMGDKFKNVTNIIPENIEIFYINVHNLKYNQSNKTKNFKKSSL